MKRNKSNERMIQKKVERDRNKRIAQMSNQTPKSNAEQWFKHPAYQARSLIREQGEQMERNDVLGYMDKLGHDVKGEMLIEKEDS